jgi:hypothetical protein
MSMWANDELDVRIVEVAGSSPVTSTEKSSSDPIAHLCLDRYAPRRDSMCSLAEANRCADLAADSTRCGAPRVDLRRCSRHSARPVVIVSSEGAPISAVALAALSNNTPLSAPVLGQAVLGAHRRAKTATRNSPAARPCACLGRGFQRLEGDCVRPARVAW